MLTKIFLPVKKLFNFKKSKFWGRDIRSVAYCGFQRLGKATADKNSFKRISKGQTKRGCFCPRFDKLYIVMF